MAQVASLCVLVVLPETPCAMTVYRGVGYVCATQDGAAAFAASPALEARARRAIITDDATQVQSRVPATQAQLQVTGAVRRAASAPRDGAGGAAPSRAPTQATECAGATVCARRGPASASRTTVTRLVTSASLGAQVALLAPTARTAVKCAPGASTTSATAMASAPMVPLVMGFARVMMDTVASTAQ